MNRNLRTAALTTASQALNRMLDMTAFLVGWGAYLELLESDGGEQLREDPHVEAHWADSEILMTRAQRQLPNLIESTFGPLMGEARFTPLKAVYNLAAKPIKGAEQARRQAEFLSEVFARLQSAPQILRETFSAGQQPRIARAISSAAANSDPRGVLNILASLTALSSVKLYRDWLRKAASLVGAEPSPTAVLVNEAVQAADFGRQLQTLATRKQALPVGSEEAADAAEEEAQVQGELDDLVANSDNPQVVLSAGVQGVLGNGGGLAVSTNSTQIGRQLSLSPEQEEALMLRGRGIIAAGAGSGKTRVLAGKVGWHVRELGLSPGQILATSFSRKSAAELLERIEKYGTAIGPDDMTGFGTTHSISAKLMREYGGSSREGIKNWQTPHLIRIAIEQVKMGPSAIEPPASTSLFEGAAAGEASKAAEPGLTFKAALELAQSRANSSQGRQRISQFHRGFLNSFFDQSNQWYAITIRQTNNLWTPMGLSTKQQDILQAAFKLTGVSYHPDKDPNLNPPEGTQQALPGTGRRASSTAWNGARDMEGFQEGSLTSFDVTAAKDKDKGLREKYRFFSEPAGEWFNLGLDPQGDEAEPATRVPLGHFKVTISKMKGQLLSPSQVWHQALEKGSNEQMMEAAVYAAYEWLKGPTGEEEFAGKGDFSDVLIDASKMLLSNANTRSKVQRRFKCVMVDEAQDLNRCVHGDTEVQTPDGPKAVRDLQAGDQVMSYENGRVTLNLVREKVRSSWERGYRVHLSTGESLTMSPNHRIYATPLDGCREGEMALYLMYRKDMGFRLGTSSRLFEARATSNGRASQEGADCAWILEMGSPEEILFKEQALSLTHAVPTYIFEGTARGCNQDRIDRLFQEFGENGREMLSKYDLSFEYPHWIASAVQRGQKDRQVVNFCAHRNKSGQRGSHVSMTWTNGDFDLPIPVYNIKGGRKMASQLTVDYATGRETALNVARQTGAYMVESLSIQSEKLPLMTASALFPGMKLPVWRGGVDLKSMLPIADYREIARRLEVSLEGVGGSRNTGKVEIHTFLRELQLQRGVHDVLPPVDGSVIDLVEIEYVEQVEGGDYWDIAVEGAHNFFGNGILSHNSQHLLFGLIAGWIDPAKAENIGTVAKVAEVANEDGSMTADTYCFIGDDKQAIYEFRGADPEAFIDLSDQVGGGAFKTAILRTNYRSGKTIVDAAGKLIAHNSKQIPMVCEANPRRGDPGAIRAKGFSPNQGRTGTEGSQEAAAYVCDEIVEMMEIGGPDVSNSDVKGYDSFGLALRTNAEAFVYGNEMLKRGIPFRSKINFFRDKNTKALIHWMTIADEGLNGDRTRINKAVIEARSVPATKLGPKFQQVLEEQAAGENYLVWLINGGWRQIYGPRGEWGDLVKSYVDNLAAVASLKGQVVDETDDEGADPTSPNQSILNFILALRGFDGSSMQDSLVDAVRNDEEAIAELISENDTGSVNEDALVERALAPIGPLKGLLDNRADLTGAMDYIRELSEANEKMAADDDPDAKGFKSPAVTLSTMHGWKGLEVPNLYVPMVGGKFPRENSPDEDLASERRLAYVALTRAQNNCTVLDIPTVITKKGGGTIVLSSQFPSEACLPFGSPNHVAGEHKLEDVAPDAEPSRTATQNRLTKIWFSAEE